MVSYARAFVTGDLDPFWPHVVLLFVSVLASITVAAGIIFERPNYSPSIHRVAFWLIVGGVAVEALCTIFLFVFDEGISGAQQSKIIALERKLAPRVLTKGQADTLVEKLKRFSSQQYAVSVATGEEPVALLCILDLLLGNAGWKRHDPFGALQVGLNCSGAKTAALNFASGIQIRVRWGSAAETMSAFDTLVSALKSDDLDVQPALDNTNIPEPNIINVMVGSKS